MVERFFGTLEYEHLHRALIGDGNALAVELGPFRRTHNTLRLHPTLDDRTARQADVTGLGTQYPPARPSRWVDPLPTRPVIGRGITIASEHSGTRYLGGTKPAPIRRRALSAWSRTWSGPRRRKMSGSPPGPN
ncbi:hypothetical protein [Amycolatopsis sp. FDAARGOS 1241]|uniref:hypothetical protein n=1 Tax=Amycolatopsis sp. FDAARGOS 1241 TaxID=2778070 RepID=UPI0019517291|nr:hypothetical protein I6J71_32400 [Amycolatopsis sp. FDAARGOS 1241]